ncbi:MAG: DJ-1/PfpI family protein [Spirochaetia bacterium]|jgi:putative intracellular protease/amidase
MNERSDLGGAGRAIETARRTGIDVVVRDDLTVWTGPFSGNNKPKGPLSGKRVGVVVASEFSDFQAYYLVSYIGELGGICEFLLADWMTWKFVRPNITNKGIRGMWDVSVDPMPVLGGNKNAAYKSLRAAAASDYDAIVIVGGHSADIMVIEPEIVGFVGECHRHGAIVGAIGAGVMLLIASGVIKGKRCTGDRTVDYMLKRIAQYTEEPVASDGTVITARGTPETPSFLEAMCIAVSPSYRDPWKGTLSGKSVLFLIGEDFEDIEVVVPTLELIHRGANVIIGKFPPEMKSRPPLIGLDVRTGNFGVSIPFQEIPETYYTLMDLAEIKMADFDVAVITGAFNPWNIVATGTTEWVKEAYTAGKIIAALCHGPIPLAAADLVRGKRLTGWLAAKDSVEIMGGEFHPGEWAAAIDGRIVTGRAPPEIPEFLDAISVALLS